MRPRSPIDILNKRTHRDTHTRKARKGEKIILPRQPSKHFVKCSFYEMFRVDFKVKQGFLGKNEYGLYLKFVFYVFSQDFIRVNFSLKSNTNTAEFPFHFPMQRWKAIRYSFRSTATNAFWRNCSYKRKLPFRLLHAQTLTNRLQSV